VPGTVVGYMGMKAEKTERQGVGLSLLQQSSCECRDTVIHQREHVGALLRAFTGQFLWMAL
jgi:hypothetical protein